MGKYGGPGGYGHVHDPNHKAGRLPVSHLLFGDARKLSVADTPKAVSLRDYGPAPSDQGFTSTCYAHAPASGIYGTARGQGIALAPWFPAAMPSQKGIADATRMIARGKLLPPGFQGKLPPLNDSGQMPSDMLEAISTVGLRPRVVLTPDDHNSDVDPATINDEEMFGELELARQTLVTGEHFLDEWAADYEAQIRATLARKIWVGTGMYVDTKGPRSVEGWDPKTGPLGAPDMGDADGGWHFVVICGYDTKTDGSTLWWVLNSWGTSWGFGGYFLADARWLAGTSNTVPFSVRLGPAPALGRTA